jgi:hypothetical protein
MGRRVGTEDVIVGLDVLVAELLDRPPTPDLDVEPSAALPSRKNITRACEAPTDPRRHHDAQRRSRRQLKTIPVNASSTGIARKAIDRYIPPDRRTDTDQVEERIQ